MTRKVLLLVFSLLALLGPALAATSAEVAKARKLSAEASEAYRAGRFEEALAKFVEANRLVPHPTIDVNLGRTYEALGQADQALVHCKIALNAPGVPEKTRAAAQTCVDRANALLARPMLEITSTPIGAAVRVDGKLVGETPWKGPIEAGRRQLDLSLEGYKSESRAINAERGQTAKVAVPLATAEMGGLLSITSVPNGATVTLDGEVIGTTPLQSFQVAARAYLLEVALPGHVPETATITVADGRHLERTVTLLPDGKTSAPGEPRVQWPAWAMMGVGAAALGLGGYFGAQALSARDDADKLARTSGAAEDRDRYDSLVSDMESHRGAADVLFVSGSAVVAGGLAWLFWPED